MCAASHILMWCIITTANIDTVERWGVFRDRLHPFELRSLLTSVLVIGIRLQVHIRKYCGSAMDRRLIVKSGELGDRLL
jgi:hypothetical protein